MKSPDTKWSRPLKDLKLNFLLKVTQAINRNAQREELFSIFLRMLTEHLNIGKVALFTHDPDWHCAIQQDVNVEDLKINVEQDLLPIMDITQVNLKSKLHFDPFDVVIPILHKKQPLAYLLIGDIDEERPGMSPTIKHLPYIQTLANVIVVAIENKKFAREQLEQEGLKRELEMASEMQNMLFPLSLPKNSRVEIAASYHPHHQVGGDYYDYIKLTEQEFAFCLADVSGKGVAAAFLMSNFQANLRILIRRLPLFYLVQRLNVKVMESAKGEKFITFFIAKYNMETRQLRYINAGHNPPMLFSEINGKQPVELRSGCPGLGMINELPAIEEGNIIVPASATLICYTDGVVDLENIRQQEFGMEALRDVIGENLHLSMEELNKHILLNLAEHKGNQPYLDDITLFNCRFF